MKCLSTLLAENPLLLPHLLMMTKIPSVNVLKIAIFAVLQMESVLNQEPFLVSDQDLKRFTNRWLRARLSHHILSPKMNIIRNSPEFLISFDSSFILIENDPKKYGEYRYVIYNSTRHCASRFSKLEIYILDLVYRYDNPEYVYNKFSKDKQKVIHSFFRFIQKSEILKTSSESPYLSKKEIPQTYYLHFTYRCNLSCTYCYNKSIRKNETNELSSKNWKKIINIIKPYAKNIVLTGGETFLYNELLDTIQYIKKEIPHINLSCISNCMHDFSSGKYDNILNYLDDITFSCDDLQFVDKRIGFDKELFKKNIQYIRSLKPNLAIGIASTISKDNINSLQTTKEFCTKTRCNMSCTLLSPNTLDDMELIPDISSLFRANDTILNYDPSNDIPKRQSLNPKKLRCGAAATICSIAPNGDVYPCQNLHYPEFLMGNMLKNNFLDMNYINSQERLIPTVDELTSCKTCNVRYLCGGGCLANSYRLYHKFTRNQITCPLNYNFSINLLANINNREQ